MRLALDSNVMIHAEGGNDEGRRLAAHRIIEGVLPSQILVPLQAAAETFRWLVHKGGFDRALAARRTSWWLDKFTVQDTNRVVFDNAAGLAVAHGLQFFDAVIVAAAAAGGAAILLSEDMQNGFKWHGVTIVNPFAASPSQLIEDLLRSRE